MSTDAAVNSGWTMEDIGVATIRGVASLVSAVETRPGGAGGQSVFTACASDLEGAEVGTGLLAGIMEAALAEALDEAFMSADW